MSSGEESFFSHLVELRNRLLWSVAVLGVAAGGLGFFAADLYTLLSQPLLSVLPGEGKMIATEVVAPFFALVKVVMIAAFAVTLPHTLYQLWAFVAPGLYDHEKKLVLPLVVSSTILFFIGAGFCYFLVFKAVFGFMVKVVPAGVIYQPDVSNFLSFALTMFMVFGLAFEVPVVVVVLARAGIVTVEKLVEIRRYVIVGAFVVAAIFTPPDVVSQFMLAIPLCILYELGIIAARFVTPKGQSETEDAPSQGKA